MMLEETLNKLLRDMVNLILESPGFTIKAKQPGAPRPTGAYAAVELLSDSSLGWEQFEYQDNQGDPDITETISGVRNIVMSISFYRDSSVDNARTVRTGLVRSSMQSLFNLANVGLGVRSVVRQFDEPLSEGYEERAQFDVTLNVVGSDQDIVRSIATLDIEGEYQSRGLIYNFNIEV